jgi:hypothetical protein
LNLAKTQNFQASPLLPYQGQQPYHYKLYINPYQPSDPFIVEVLYKRPYRQHQRPIPTIQSSYFGDLPSLLAKIVNIFGGTAPKFATILSRNIFPKPTDPVKFGTLGEIFYDTNAKGSVFGMAVAVEAANCERVLIIMEKLLNQLKVPGLPSMRFIKGTEATLGFTYFPKTAVVEVDGIQWKNLQLFLSQLTTEMNSSNMDFGLHWGKNADWSVAIVDRMYGTKKAAWILERNKLISSALRPVFANKFLDEIGLS